MPDDYKELYSKLSFAGQINLGTWKDTLFAQIFKPNYYNSYLASAGEREVRKELSLLDLNSNHRMSSLLEAIYWSFIITEKDKEKISSELADMTYESLRTITTLLKSDETKKLIVEMLRVAPLPNINFTKFLKEKFEWNRDLQYSVLSLYKLFILLPTEISVKRSPLRKVLTALKKISLYLYLNCGTFSSKGLIFLASAGLISQGSNAFSQDFGAAVASDAVIINQGSGSTAMGET
jgi:hypothetical protein